MSRAIGTSISAPKHILGATCGKLIPDAGSLQRPALSRAIRTPRVFGTLLTITVACVCVVEAPPIRAQQETPGAPSNLPPADVIVLVVPLSEDTARIAVDYRTRVDRSRVLRELHALAQTGGWTIGRDVSVNIDAVQPGNAAKYPRTIGAVATFTHAPQVVDHAPVLMPYLQAFRSWRQIEVLFGVGDLRPFRGITSVDNNGLSVLVVHDPGVYRYEVQFRRHSGPVSLDSGVARAWPTLTAQQRPAAPAAGLPARSAAMLVVIGGLIAGAAGAYVALTRHTHGRTGAHRLG